MNLFGFNIERTRPLPLPSFASPITDDGAINTSVLPMYADAYIDMEGVSRSERDIITKYRQVALHPELQRAIDDVINELVLIDETKPLVSLNLDRLAIDDGLKQLLQNEFQSALFLLDFQNNAYEILKTWYIDGRMYYHIIIDESHPENGIQELRYLDPRKIKLIREMQDSKDQAGNPIRVPVNEFFIYDDTMQQQQPYLQNYTNDVIARTIKIAKDSIAFCTSGLVDEGGKMILSHLHGALKPLNQLRMLEDAAIIYTLSRAPERRIFYVDVGGMPDKKAEQHLYNSMIRHKNRLIYDATTGTIRDDRKMMTLIEDYWFPRRGDGRATEVTTLPAGQQLGEMTHVEYFRQKLYQSLNIPASRMNQDTPYILGRAAEISRDELNFQKFIIRLRKRFSMLFNSIMEKQLALKQIMGPEDFKSISQQFVYDFSRDNYFIELQKIEMLKAKAEALNMVVPFTQQYISRHEVRREVLGQSDQEIAMMDQEIMMESEQDLQKQATLQMMAAQMGFMPPQGEGQ